MAVLKKAGLGPLIEGSQQFAKELSVSKLWGSVSIGISLFKKVLEQFNKIDKAAALPLLKSLCGRSSKR
jgi:hypothetical protein